MANIHSNSRRKFLKSATFAACIPFSKGYFTNSKYFLPLTITDKKAEMNIDKSIIGQYGNWASSLVAEPPALSFRNGNWKNISAWKDKAITKTKELIAVPDLGTAPKYLIDKEYEFDGLLIQEVSWQLGYGRPTKAVILKPIGISKPLPAILGLHDHAGMKYFGYRKIVQTSEEQHPIIEAHQISDYGGKAWANEIAKRGYVVMVHDTFTFGSRRVHYEDVEGITWGPLNTKGKSDENPEKEENISNYNEWASEHEHVMSKSLFCAGTTWPGVFLAEDQVALDILASLKEVDSERIGCCGLSGGGLRTVYLGGLDPRIKCAICVGFMSTWNDFLLYKAYTHTWMTYTPLLPKYLNFPEILGLRVPLPTMVLNNNQDPLYTLPEMKKADRILKEVFEKANASDKYQAHFYDGEHKFDVTMQADAFEWFEKWLS